MTVRQIRPYPEPTELRAMYREAHDSRAWGQGHGVRVDLTIAAARAYRPEGWASVVDLSAGNGLIARGVHTVGMPSLGDLAPGPAIHDALVGPLEETLPTLSPGWDLFVSCETLEHLRDPLAVLVAARAKAKGLLLSTPVHDAGDDDTNAEHVWQWDIDGVDGLLADAGWVRRLFVEVDCRALDGTYRYGVWICE